MKTLKNITLVLIMFVANMSIAQTIAVGTIQTSNVYAHSTTATKLLRMELIKLNKYQLFDEFDLNEIENADQFHDCFSRVCLIEYGQTIGSDFVISGSIDKISGKIIISLKLIDVKSEKVAKTITEQFDDNESELQRMIRISTQKLHGIEPDAELYKQLQFKNELITSNNVGKINNSGPRMGVAYAHGTIAEFLTRSEGRGGMEMAPVFSNIGYQFEAQYVGTENFSALFEFIPSLNGLEQGKFIPSFAFMNGFRFGSAGWEFAFGPTFGLTRKSEGFFDHDGIYDGHNYGQFWSRSDLSSSGFDNSDAAIEENGYMYSSILDSRGDWKFSTRWVMAVGRTFKSGALNIPVNIFYSSVKGGGMLGLSAGFNITRKKSNIN